MKYYTAILLFLLLSISVFSQINQYGISLITNYTPDTYEASEQNWSITQDNRGVLYIGNNDRGILEYDGVNWRKIPIKNGSIVRSLATDKNGTVYVGAVNDFGILKINDQGLKYFESLRNQISDSNLNFADVWKTVYLDSSVYFGCQDYIFNYHNGILKEFKLTTAGTLFLFDHDDKLFYSVYADGLYNFNKGESTLALGGEFTKQKGVYSFSSFQDKILVGTYPQGLYWYNNKTGASEIAYPKTYLNSFTKENQLYHTSVYDSNTIVLSTLYNGAIVANSKGKIKNHFNKKIGLQDETVISSYIDLNKNIWLSLNKGVSKIEQNNPIRHFGDNQGIQGTIMDICQFNNQLFVASTLGVFYKSKIQNNTPSFLPIKEIAVNTWSILPIEETNFKQLLVGTFEGLYAIDENLKAEFIDAQISESNNKNKKNYIQKLYQSKKDPYRVYVALYDGVFSIRFNGKKWQREKNYDVKGSDIRHIIEDNDGNIWFATYMNGVIQCKNNNPDNITFYNTNHGIPSLNEIVIGLINDNVSIGTKEGFWKYNSNKDNFSKDTALANFKASVYYFNQDLNGNLWISAYKDHKRFIERYIFDKSNNRFIKNSTPFKRLPSELVDKIYHDNKGNIAYFGTSSGLYSFNNNAKIDYNLPYYTLIRKVIAKTDSIIFAGTYFQQTKNLRLTNQFQPEELKLDLTYNLNDLTFEYAAPYFIEEQKTLFSYKLEGYNKKWSKWSLETKAIFTNLNEGEYTFKAKAKNIYDIESSIGEYKFTISPPWYRTILAYVIYVIFSILFVIFIVKLYTRRLEQEKIRLEGIVQERTAEIRKQNNILEQQKEEILEQKEEITASIHYAQRIQTAIVPNEEMAKNLLKNYFLLWKPRDIVSGDFWWLGEKNGYVVATAADCTGHGVPGAFMSMLGVSFLNEIIKQQNITNSGEILNRLRDKVKTTLGQTDHDSTSKDGMDMGLLVIDFKNMKAQFSGAYNPLFLYRDGELIEYKATRNPIAVYIKEKPFTENEIEIKKGDTMYMFSDGFPDQFGGDKDKKYSTKRFKQYLASIQEKTMEVQKNMLDAEIEDWMKNTKQIDDIIILGIRI